MKPLEVICRNRVLYVRISVEDKGIDIHDYYLYNKNGISFYIFRKEEGVWKLVYGQLADDIREACIDALILRFDENIGELFYHQGVRQLVEVSPKKFSLWHVYLNNSYKGSIQFNPTTMEFTYHLEDDCILKDDNIQKYITKIQRGEIKWYKDDYRVFKLPKDLQPSFNY